MVHADAPVRPVAGKGEIHSLNVAIALLAKAKEATTEEDFIEFVREGYREAHKVWHDRYVGIGS